MLKKRFLLALIAASMSLAGCGKKNNKPVEPETPSGPVDPGEGGGEEGGGEEEDKLTPEQRENANSIKTIIDGVLPMLTEEEVSEEVGKYTLAYSEEVAVEDVKLEAVTSHMLDIMVILNDPNAKAIVDFLGGVKEDGSLKDIVYIATAFGKSYLRASQSDEEYGPVFEYVADYLDEEGSDLHYNLYGFIDATVGCAAILGSDEFIEAIGSVYSEEENQLNVEAIQSVLNKASDALYEFCEGEVYASYLASLLFDGVVKFAEEVIELDQETIDMIKSIDVEDIVWNIYGCIDTASAALEFYAEEGSPVLKVVSLVNMVLAEEYLQLVLTLITDYLTFIGIEEEDQALLLGGLAGTLFSCDGLLQIVSEELSKDFVDEESGKYSALLIEEAVANIGEALENFAQLETLLNMADEVFVKVVHNTLTVVAGFEEEEATDIANKFDVTGKISDVFADIKTLGESLQDVDDRVFEVVAHFLNEEFDEGIELALVTLFEEIGTEVTYQEVKEDVNAIAEKVIGIVEHFESEEFKEKYEAVIVTDESGSKASVEKMKELVLDVGETLEDLLLTKANVLNLGEDAVDVVKHILPYLGFSDDEIEEMFAEFDVEEFVNYVYDNLETGIEFIKAAGDAEGEEFDLYYEAVKSIMDEVLDENSTPLTVALVVVMQVVHVTFVELDIQSVGEMSFIVGLGTPVIYVMSVKTHFESEEFLELVYALVNEDEESGVRTVDGEAVKALCEDIAGSVFTLGVDALTAFLKAVDGVEEITGKVSDYDIEAEDSVFNQIRDVVAQIQEEFEGVASLLNNEEEALEPFVSLVVEYGNLLLEGYGLYEEYVEEGEIEDYKVVEYLVRVASKFLHPEIEEFNYESYADADELVLAAIGVSFEEGESKEDSGHAFGLGELHEEDGVYYVDIILVEEYSYAVTDGEVTAFAASGEIRSFELPVEVVEAINSLHSLIGDLMMLE